MANILCIGIATLDIINTVKTYPDEDDEIRIITQEKRRGGNATNTAVVLSQLGHQCGWAGTLVNESDKHIILAELEHFNVDYDACDFLNQGKLPTSYISISQETGSRTISHYRDLPELSFTAFKQIDLAQYDWFHFEGRNIEQTQKMMLLCRQQHPMIPISVEIEKPRPAIEALITFADVIFFSQHYARSLYYHSAQDLCQIINRQYPDKIITCTWGDSGAGASQHQQYVWQAALPIKAIDTLAAGDVFNAGMIDQQLQQTTLRKSLDYACQLAAEKCKHQGITHFQPCNNGISSQKNK